MDYDAGISAIINAPLIPCQMPMNISLKTNLTSDRLELVDLVKYRDNSGYGCGLIMESFCFAGHLPFYFEPYPLTAFIAQLEAMDTTLQGSAVLKPMYEEPYIKIEMLSWGRVRVSGELMYYGEIDQRLQIAFDTDQTVLRPLINDLQILERLDVRS